MDWGPGRRPAAALLTTVLGRRQLQWRYYAKVIGRENRIPPRMDPPKTTTSTNKQTKRKSSETTSLTVVVDAERRLGGVVLEGKMSW